MRKVHIMSGIPGSGKSTFIQGNAKELDIKLHRDWFRAELRIKHNTTEYFPVPAAEEWKLWTDIINGSLMNLPDRDIWIDQTTNGVNALSKLLNTLQITENDEVIIHVFNIPFEVALERNNKRTGLELVPEDVMYSFHEGFQKNLITKSRVRRVIDKPYHVDVQFHNEV